MKKVIVTIGREFGSGGREIGLKLSERLGIPFYDKKLILHTAEKTNLEESIVEKYDEQHSFPAFSSSTHFSNAEILSAALTSFQRYSSCSSGKNKL